MQLPNTKAKTLNANNLAIFSSLKFDFIQAQTEIGKKINELKINTIALIDKINVASPIIFLKMFNN